MSQQYKICPICRTPAHKNAVLCSTCGATLGDIDPAGEPNAKGKDKPAYDHRYGEADLFEGQMSRRSDVFFVGALVTLAIIACIGGVVLIGPRLFSRLVPMSQVGSDQATLTAVPTRAGAGGPNATAAPIITNTPRPTLQLATVTPAPPTPTITPTQGPCTVTVAAGDDLLSLAFGCGHRTMDIIPLILELNELDAPENMQVGQVLEIPWPTPTPDPNDIPTEEVSEDDSAALDAVVDPNITLAPVEVALRNSAAIATETLQPGVSWHQVQSGDSIASIAYTYGADVEILSQLNPEITFSQCDFGSPSGGPGCIVSVYIGQLVRVPAPTPTPTIPPTPSGSETATPSPSPTFNAPSLTDPGNRTLFTRDQLITLRWVASGTLGPNQVYRVQAEDTTAGVVYNTDTQDLFMIVPEAWQSSDGRRHEYVWRVSVVDKDRPNDPIYTTDTRMFSWEARQPG